jgi:hypothetical protein
MTKLIAFVFALALSGCGAPPIKPMTTPDGKPGFLLSCDGVTDDWTSCYAAAATACKGKYTIIDRNESSTPTGLTPAIRRYLIVECRNN